MLLLPHEVVLRNLMGRIDKDSKVYRTPEETLRDLIAISGCNFGFDEEAWRSWIMENYDVFSLRMIRGR